MRQTPFSMHLDGELARTLNVALHTLVVHTGMRAISEGEEIALNFAREIETGANTVAAFSARARSGMGVSMPIAWDELKDIGGLRGDNNLVRRVIVVDAVQWTIKNAAHRQRTLGADPWQGYFRRQGITAAMRRAVGMR